MISNILFSGISTPRTSCMDLRNAICLSADSPVVDIPGATLSVLFTGLNVYAAYYDRVAKSAPHDHRHTDAGVFVFDSRKCYTERSNTLITPHTSVMIKRAPNVLFMMGYNTKVYMIVKSEVVRDNGYIDIIEFIVPMISPDKIGRW